MKNESAPTTTTPSERKQSIDEKKHGTDEKKRIDIMKENRNVNGKLIAELLIQHDVFYRRMMKAKPKSLIAVRCNVTVFLRLEIFFSIPFGHIK